MNYITDILICQYGFGNFMSSEDKTPVDNRKQYGKIIIIILPYMNRFGGVLMRERLYLNYGWRYAPDYKPEYLRNDLIDATFKLVDIPHMLNELPYSCADDSVYQHVATYRKMFILPSTMDDKRIMLHFEGVMNCAAVFINGKKVVASKGGYTPFECDITSFIQNGDNLLTVVVDASQQDDTPPFGGVVPYLTGGGIYRSVWIEAAERIYISKVYTRPIKTEKGWKIAVRAEALGGTTADYKMYLFDGEEKIASQYCSATNSMLDYEWELPVEIKTWTLEEPKIYRFAVALANGDVIDTRLGFRTVEFKNDGFYLNSEKVLLNGINRYQSYPYVAGAMPAAAEEHDAQLIKDCGFNAVRCADGPASPEFLDKCDELGLLVLEDLPVCGFVGDEQWQENLIMAAYAAFDRDVCHPSVIMWGVGDDGALAAKLSKALHTTDPSRLTYSESVSQGVCDVPAVYDEPVSEIHAPFGRKNAFIVTSYSDNTGYQALIENELVAGTFFECFADHNVKTSFENRDGIAHTGIFDMFRIPKNEAYQFRAMLTKEPFIHAYFDNDGTAVVSTNCDSFIVYRDDKVVGDYANQKSCLVDINDFCGSLLESAEKLDAKKAEAVKKLMDLTRQDFRKFTFDSKRTSVFEKKMALDVPALTALYQKYNNHSLDCTYTFEGIKDGKAVCKCVKGAIAKVTLKAELINNAPTHAETFDVTIIKLTALDENANRVYGCNEAINVEVDGSIEIIGPKCFALVDGARSFAIRTKGGRGEAQVRITSEAFGKQTLYIDVERKSQRDINHSRLEIK